MLAPGVLAEAVLAVMVLLEQPEQLTQAAAAVVQVITQALAVMVALAKLYFVCQL
jgi:hypothetical protein